jgi:hypothetical protein
MRHNYLNLGEDEKLMESIKINKTQYIVSYAEQFHGRYYPLGRVVKAAAHGRLEGIQPFSVVATETTAQQRLSIHAVASCPSCRPTKRYFFWFASCCRLRRIRNGGGLAKGK